MHSDEYRHTQPDPGECQCGTQHMPAGIGPADELEENHRRISSSILPSRMRTVRGQLSATSLSWVTSTTVVPRRACRFWISFKIPAPATVSRFPVGSSPRRIGG